MPLRHPESKGSYIFTNQQDLSLREVYGHMWKPLTAHLKARTTMNLYEYGRSAQHSTTISALNIRR